MRAHQTWIEPDSFLEMRNRIRRLFRYAQHGQAKGGLRPGIVGFNLDGFLHMKKSFSLMAGCFPEQHAQIAVRQCQPRFAPQCRFKLFNGFVPAAHFIQCCCELEIGCAGSRIDPDRFTILRDSGLRLVRLT
jgi:hypothetical protein